MSAARKPGRHQASSKTKRKASPASKPAARHSARKSSTLSLLIRRLSSAKKMCLYAFIGCLAAAGLVFSILFLPDLMRSEELSAQKSAEAVLQSMRDGSFDPDSGIDLEGFPIGRVLLGKAEDSEMPEGFYQAYCSAVIHGWQLENLEKRDGNIELTFSLSTLDPDTFSVSVLSGELQNIFYENAQEQNEGSGQEDREALRQSLYDQAYSYLGSRLDEAEYYDVPIIVTVSKDGKSVLAIRQEARS